MTLATKNIVKAATRKPEDNLNIVSLVCNGSFEQMISHTGFNFYSSLKATKDTWNLGTFTKPNNFYLFDSDNLVLPSYLTIDAVICHDRYTHYLNALNLSRILHIPLILVEHAVPPRQMRREEIFRLCRQSPPDLTIYPQQVIKDAWKNEGQIIPYGVELGKPVEKEIDILIPGKFNKIDYPLIQEIIKQLKDYNVCAVGDNQGISKSAPSFNEYISLFAKSKIVLSLNVGLFLPFETLYAAANHCAIVANTTPVVEGLLNENNALLSKRVEGLVEHAKALLKDENEIKRLADGAFELAQEYSLEKVIPLWQSAIKDITSKTYVRKNEA